MDTGRRAEIVIPVPAMGYTLYTQYSYTQYGGGLVYVADVDITSRSRRFNSDLFLMEALENRAKRWVPPFPQIGNQDLYDRIVNEYRQ